MKKKSLVIICIVLFVVLSVLLFLIFGLSKDNEVELKDYSYVNVEEIKTKEFAILNDNILDIRNVKIVEGYLEGVVFINSEENYKNLNFKVNIYDESGNLLDNINFNFENVLAYEERDLFYPIQKDLSKAYYVDIEEM